MAESVLVFIFKLIYLTESGDDDGWGSGTSAAGAPKSGGGGGGGGKGCFKCGEDGMCPWSAASVERRVTWPLARECPTGGSGDNKCRNCRKVCF